jgi:hypothetical protein
MFTYTELLPQQIYWYNRKVQLQLLLSTLRNAECGSAVHGPAHADRWRGSSGDVCITITPSIAHSGTSGGTNHPTALVMPIVASEADEADPASEVFGQMSVRYFFVSSFLLSQFLCDVFQMSSVDISLLVDFCTSSPKVEEIESHRRKQRRRTTSSRRSGG